ncbi:MAG: phosphotransferase [Chloroflexi bacterium]|nr:phosphotransferase [Chloroflexota bacterium]
MATNFVAGSNLKGCAAGANWTFLLPRLELEQIVCIGALPLTSLPTLSRLGQQVWIVSSSAQQVRHIAEASSRIRLRNLQLIFADNPAELPFASQTSDVVVIGGRSGLRRLQRDHALLTEIRRVLKPEGWVYLEFGGLLEALFDRRDMENLSEEFGGAQLFWLTPSQGEMQTAVPLRDRAMRDYFLNHRLYGPSIELRGWGHAEHLLNKNRFVARLTHRRGALAGCGASNGGDQLPAYLQSILREAGFESSNYRWGLSAPGDYNSRKVLFFLFDRASGTPEFIVKMTRDPALNYRLENECHALIELRQKEIGCRETMPQIAFHGNHASLAIVGETFIEGVPFRARTRATSDGPYVRAAITCLTDLGAQTADHSAATPLQAAACLKILFDRFREFYSLTPEHDQFLTDQIAAIASSSDPFPVVFQHGDPGTWNVLVTPAGGIAFLDWEAAESKGMPLWDLFYFLRSYSVWVARAHGTRDRLKGLAQQFLAESSLSALVVESVERYCVEVGVPRHLVEPLFYTCWMHRALKESTRLPPAELENGSYVRFLRLCIAQRDAPTLKQIFQRSSDVS